MSHSIQNPWLHRFAVLTALATFALLGVGGLVTSHGVGMAVPDWPNSNGYNMFLFPPSQWVGGILYEHSHRLVASTVGLLVVFLTRWLGGRKSRGPLAVIGLLEILAGTALLALKPELKGAGHFLTGIGGVVLLAALVWARNDPAPGRLPALGWWAFGLVQLQGLLGGLRVVLLKDEIGIFHATLAQLFFALVCAIALFTSKSWERQPPARRVSESEDQRAVPEAGAPIRRLFLFTTILIFLQLVLGATMRHQHAGLAIPDFPLAHGRLWPAMDAASIQNYNARRVEITEANPITAFQIGLQMVHRLMALAILVCVGTVAGWAGRWGADLQLGVMGGEGNAPNQSSALQLRRLAFVWLALIFIQIGLGAWTIWSNKAADVATAHVLVGALSLVTGVLGCLICFRRFARVSEAQGAPVAGVPRTHRPAVAIN